MKQRSTVGSKICPAFLPEVCWHKMGDGIEDIIMTQHDLAIMVEWADRDEKHLNATKPIALLYTVFRAHFAKHRSKQFTRSIGSDRHSDGLNTEAVMSSWSVPTYSFSSTPRWFFHCVRDTPKLAGVQEVLMRCVSDFRQLSFSEHQKLVSLAIQTFTNFSRLWVCRSRRIFLPPLIKGPLLHAHKADSKRYHSATLLRG